jgi:hypothetical protein
MSKPWLSGLGLTWAYCHHRRDPDRNKLPERLCPTLSQLTCSLGRRFQMSPGLHCWLQCKLLWEFGTRNGNPPLAFLFSSDYAFTCWSPAHPMTRHGCSPPLNHSSLDTLTGYLFKFDKCSLSSYFHETIYLFVAGGIREFANTT